MKKVLSLLLPFVLLEAQSWALSGGPIFGTSQQSLVGVYAGALLPSGDEGDVGGNNGLGLFTLDIPDTGLGSGDFVYFSEGRTFTGTITGIADPEDARLVGLLKGQFDIIVDSITIDDDTFGDASLVQTRPGGFANGQIEAEFVPGSSGFSGGTVGGAVTSGLRIEGTASVEISEFVESSSTDDNGTPDDTSDDVTTTTATVVPTGTVSLTVDGFRQSTVSGSANNLAIPNF